MAIGLRQSATVDAASPTATWPLGAPNDGSLLVAVAFHRGAAGDAAIFPAGWDTRVDRKTELSDNGHRRALAVATRVADTEGTTVAVTYGGEVTRLSVYELEPDDGETFTFLRAVSNDNGTTLNGSSIGTATTADSGDGPRFVIGAFGGRAGSSGHILEGTHSWTNDLGNITNHFGTANGRVTSLAFGLHDDGGTKTSTATTQPGSNTNTGLSAGLLVFDPGLPVEVNVAHGLVMDHSSTVTPGATEIAADVAHGLLMGHTMRVDTDPDEAPGPIVSGVQAEQLTATWTPDGGAPRALGRGGGFHGMITQPGIIGLDLPPDSQFDQDIASGDGSIMLGRRRLPRELIFAVWIAGHTLTEAENRRRQLSRDFDPKREGTFTWSLPDGTSRSLRCRTSEFEPEQGHRMSAQLQGSYRITLRARDPYWLGEEKVLVYATPSGENFYGGGVGEGDGAPPYNISESSVFGQSQITIDGDEATWPMWELHGPMTTADLDNVTSGRTLSLTPNLLEGETLFIRTDPRVLAAMKFTDDNGDNVWAAVAGQFPDLWPLLEGTQTIDVSAAGGDTDNTKIVLRYRGRYVAA